MLAILPIGVLSIPAGSDLLDQLPDVQRRWVEDGTGLAHALAAVMVVAVVTVAVLVLGRMRSGSLWQRTPAAVDAEEPADLRLGFIVPGVVLVAMVVIAAQGGGLPWSMPGLQPWRLIAFLAVPLVIVLVSLVIRWRLTVNPAGWCSEHFAVKPHRIPSADEKVKTVVTGDVLGAVAIVIAALGLLRSSRRSWPLPPSTWGDPGAPSGRSSSVRRSSCWPGSSRGARRPRHRRRPGSDRTRPAGPSGPGSRPR